MMNPNLRRLAAAAVALSASGAIAYTPSTASASIISTTGAVHVYAPPASVQLNAWESNTTTRIFHERTVQLQNNLAVDILGTGSFTMLNQVSPGFIASGTTIDSYLLHQDGKEVKGSPRAARQRDF